MTALTGDEREFMLHARWSDALDTGHGPIAEAQHAADTLVAMLTERVPSRTERLLVLARVARAVDEAAHGLLLDVLDAEYEWHEHERDDWRSLAWSAHDLRGLAALTSCSLSSIRKWAREAAARTLDRAKEAARAD